MRLVAGVALVVCLAHAQEIVTTKVVSGFSAPTDIQNAGDGSGRMFVVQQNGIIRLVKNGTLVSAPFMDISNKTHADGERGLLGLAFPPGFAQKQRFYVDYTNLNGDTVIAQYRMASADAGDPSSEIILLTIAQPFANHNGGRVSFGPDGYLYIGMGDGGSGGDPQGNGQNKNALLGKILRIDVESDPGHLRIPPDNPFVNTSGARGEIWALGVRNPWRFSFDRQTGDLWIGDVGQDAYEEVDFQPKSSKGGENYGWRTMEGFHCYNPSTNCNMTGLTLPVAEYPHSQGCSITGAFVYRGSMSPFLRGIYFYGDLCSGRIWGIQNGVSRLMTTTNFAITTFGEDEAGEIYVANANDGTIYRIDASKVLRVVNAASFAPGLVAGSLATAFPNGIISDTGVTSADRIPLPLTLGGVTVTVGGIPAPLLAVILFNGVEQVNFQVPFEVTGSQADVVVSRSGQSTTLTGAQVLAAQPAVYTSTVGTAVVVHNVDYTLVDGSRPLQRGEYAFLYAAGLGRVSNAPATGAGAPAGPLATGSAEVTLGGLNCDVPFAGLAPGLVGVYQVNFRVPANAVSGTQNLIVRSGGVASTPVPIPVQ